MFGWKVTRLTEPLIVNFDLNRDGKLEVTDAPPYVSQEMQAISNVQKARAVENPGAEEFDHYIFGNA